MKRLMITAALVASLVTLGFSQDKPTRARKEVAKAGKPGMEQRQERTPEQRAQMATDALDKKLSLSADQKAKIYDLNLERAQKMDKSMKSEREFRREQIEKNRSVMEDSEKKLSKILTDDQRKSYEDMKKQSRDKMKARRPQGERTRVK